MERRTGFLVHLDTAYPSTMPFMRGLYLTTNSWRPKRYRDGWKLSKQSYGSLINVGRRQGRLGYSSGSSEEDIAPKMVKLVEIFLKHLSALAELFKEDKPDLRLIRGAAILEVVYIFGYASGSGFGSLWKEWISLGYFLE